MNSRIKIYSSVKRANTLTFSLPSNTYYQLLTPNSERKGHHTENISRVPVTVYFGIELVGLYPPYPVKNKITLNPGDSYLGDISECIPLAAKWSQLSDENGIGELEIIEFF